MARLIRSGGNLTSTMPGYLLMILVLWNIFKGGNGCIYRSKLPRCPFARKRHTGGNVIHISNLENYSRAGCQWMNLTSQIEPGDESKHTRNSNNQSFGVSLFLAANSLPCVFTLEGSKSTRQTQYFACCYIRGALFNHLSSRDKKPTFASPHGGGGPSIWIEIASFFHELDYTQTGSSRYLAFWRIKFRNSFREVLPLALS